MKSLYSISIRIAECKTCVEQENSCFDEIMFGVLNDIFQIKEILDKHIGIPYIQLANSVRCDFLNCNIDAVCVSADDITAALVSCSNGIHTYHTPILQIPRETILAIMLQIEKQINNNLKIKDDGKK